mmetsp:Transcript_15899/g.31174  ORF Transcript_15899/g.31174 Transcript_15899/m.31174 type:complete len:263 (+) Transcript_15899:514-1302(+)
MLSHQVDEPLGQRAEQDSGQHQPGVHHFLRCQLAVQVRHRILPLHKQPVQHTDNRPPLAGVLVDRHKDALHRQPVGGVTDDEPEQRQDPPLRVHPPHPHLHQPEKEPKVQARYADEGELSIPHLLKQFVEHIFVRFYQFEDHIFQIQHRVHIVLYIQHQALHKERDLRLDCLHKRGLDGLRREVPQSRAVLRGGEANGGLHHGVQQGHNKLRYFRLVQPVEDLPHTEQFRRHQVDTLSRHFLGLGGDNALPAQVRLAAPNEL